MKKETEKPNTETPSGLPLRWSSILLMILAMALSVALLIISGRIAVLADAEPAALLLLAQVQQLLTVLLIVVVVVSFVLVILWLLQPINAYARRIPDRERLPLRGASELQKLAAAYNGMVEENKRLNEGLLYEAQHDGLTGLLNRRAFEEMRAQLPKQDVALLMIDADNLKGYNDTYGHDAADRALCKMASILLHSFRTSDHVFRVGGDEFVVIMTNMTPELRSVVLSKLERVRSAEQRDLRSGDQLPPVTLSVGVAFSAQSADSGKDVFNMADEALYKVKEHGRNGFAFYGEGEPVVSFLDLEPQA